MRENRRKNFLAYLRYRSWLNRSLTMFYNVFRMSATLGAFISFPILRVTPIFASKSGKIFCPFVQLI